MSDEVFIQHVLITIKNDKCGKLALDARSLNNAIQKEKYQMPSLDNLLEQVTGIINTNEEGTAMLTMLDMLYAYGQTELHPETAKNRSFQIISGRATGTYAFNTGYYGLTIMPPEIQNIMDELLHNIRFTFAIINDNLVVTKGNNQQHMEKMKEVISTKPEPV